MPNLRWSFVAMAMTAYCLAEPTPKLDGTSIVANGGTIPLKDERFGELLTTAIRGAWWGHPEALDVSVGRNSENETVLRVRFLVGSYTNIDHLFKYSEVSVAVFNEDGKELPVTPLVKGSESYSKGPVWSGFSPDLGNSQGYTALGYYAVAGANDTVSKVKVAVTDLKVSFFIPPKTVFQHLHDLSVNISWGSPLVEGTQLVVNFQAGDFRIRYGEVNVKVFTSAGKEIKVVPVPWDKDKDNYTWMGFGTLGALYSGSYAVDAKEKASKVTVEWKGEKAEFKRTVAWDRLKMEE